MTEVFDMDFDLMQGKKDYVKELVFLPDYYLKGKLTNGTSYEYRWHRSKEKQMKFPFASYMLNKKWTLEEEFNNHMLRFQQVNMRGYIFKLSYSWTL